MPPSDINADQAIGVDDILAVLEQIGACNPSRSRLCDADVRADGAVDLNDVLGVIKY